jgi:hypothetical protein
MPISSAFPERGEIREAGSPSKRTIVDPTTSPETR